MNRAVVLAIGAILLSGAAVRSDPTGAITRMGDVDQILAISRGSTHSLPDPGHTKFAEGFADPRALVEFLAPFGVIALSRAIAWRTAALQSSLSRRLGENDAWIAATALSCKATLVGRDKAFERVPQLDYLSL
jgi:hypothetical protein